MYYGKDSMCLHPMALALQLLHKYRVKLAWKLMCSHTPPNVTEKGSSKFQFLKRTGLNVMIKEEKSNEAFLY